MQILYNELTEKIKEKEILENQPKERKEYSIKIGSIPLLDDYQVAAILESKVKSQAKKEQRGAVKM